MKKIAKELRHEDAKNDLRQKELRANSSRDQRNGKPAPDARVKVPPKHRAVILKRHEAGESQADIAADYKVGQQQVSRIISKEAKAVAVKKQVEETVAKLAGENLGIITGDFREAGSTVPDNSVQLILTDPPYDGESVPLYAALAKFAARVLMPGGLCFAYAGH